MYKFYAGKFFPYEIKDSYVASGIWPENGVDVNDETYHQFKVNSAPSGMMIGSDDDGFPCWVNLPPPTHDELVAAADKDKRLKLDAAKRRISLWQTQLQLGMISDADKASLIAWMNYITALQAVDTSTAPEIDWPTPPDA